MEDNVSNQDVGLDEFGLPKGDWEDSLMDITADDLQNAMDFPLAGWAPYEALYGYAPPNLALSTDSTVALFLRNSSETIF